MARLGGIKWEKAQLYRPNNNIISSDFPKYVPQAWKYMEGPPHIINLLSHEYQRMWLAEREVWKKRMYPENTTVNVDVVKRYVLTFKTNNQPPKPEKKIPFTMKKFQNIQSKTKNRRPADEKKEKKPKEVVN